MTDPDISADVLAAARRVELFLADDAIQAALSAMKEQNYRLFLGAKDAEGRAMAQAQALVLEGFEAALRSTLDPLERQREREKTEQVRRDRAPAARPTET